MGKRNTFGLPRDIPTEVKRQVRINAGFGCVICAAIIVEYEHVDPPFASAKAHDPNSITLLCPSCHGKVTRGFISKDSVKKAMLSPASRNSGFTQDFIPIGSAHPTVVVGGSTYATCRVPLLIKGVEIFSIQPPEAEGAPYRLSGIFHDSSGKQSLRIDENRWISHGTNWDLEAARGVLCIRDAPKHESLRIRFNSPGELIFEKIDMQFRKIKIQADSKSLKIKDGPSTISFENNHVANVGVAICYG